MKFKFNLLLTIFLMSAIWSNAQTEAPPNDDGDVHLIQPIFESPAMSQTQAKNFTWLQTYRNWGIKSLGLDTIKAKFNGQGIKVCICDTGEPTHPMLKSKIAASANFTSDASAIDGNGHSTHVGGIINEIVPEAELYFAKVLADNGSGSNSGVANGVRWCKEKGAHIVNMSLGGSAPSSTLKRAIEEAVKDSIIVIAAAGNNGQSETENRMGYPARYDETIAVGSINRDLLVSWFSSSGDEGDIVAPGEKILSTWLNEEFIVLSGTSMATPYIAGMTALLLEAKNDRSEIEVKLERSAFDIAPTGYDRNSFHGIATTKVYQMEKDTIVDDEPPVEEPDDPVVEVPNEWIQSNWQYLLISAVIIGIVAFILSRQKRK